MGVPEMVESARHVRKFIVKNKGASKVRCASATLESHVDCGTFARLVAF